MWDQAISEIAGAIQPAVVGDAWSRRLEVAWYVDRCVMAGFAKTDDEKLECARRFLAGKRKVSHPGTKHRKTAAKARRKLLENPPAELLKAIETLRGSVAHVEYLMGNAKAMNAMVGQVLKIGRYDPSAVRELIEKHIAATQPA